VTDATLVERRTDRETKLRDENTGRGN